MTEWTPRLRAAALVAGSTCFILAVATRAALAQLPAVRVDHVRRVFHNGEHNAFTDLVRFRDRFHA